MSKIPSPRAPAPVIPLRTALDRPLDSRGAVREWLIDGGSPDARDASGTPLWAVVLNHAPLDAIDEVINAGANLNVRLPTGEGWLLHCLSKDLPAWLILAGFRRLNTHWWEPDQFGNSPFHDARLTVPVAQAMAARWWREARNWDLLAMDGQPVSEVASRLGREDLARVWRLWSRRPLFARRREDVHRSSLPLL